jgi:TatD DNase family protein
MKIIDTHCHLNDEKLYPIVSDVVRRAKEQGVVAVFNNGDSLASFEKILGLQKEFPGFCYSVLGIHPEFASEKEDYFQTAYQQLEAEKREIRAIGEIGLDYHWHKEPEYIADQKKRFIEQIRLAKALDLPIVIHSRDADKDTLDIIKAELPPKIDLHCYSGSYETLREYLRLPIETHIGIGGVLTFTNSRVLKEIVGKADISVFLTETDSPYLAPVPHRGKPNEPGYLPLVLEAISKIWNLPIDETADILYQNGAHFYGLE